nr:hypothetical protein [uncultured Faecalibacillus sp.]
MRYKISKYILTFLCLFIGIGAIYGSICMLLDPTGKLLQMDSMLPYFQVLPLSKYLFQDYTFSGIALLIVNGITNFIAVYFLVKNEEHGIKLGMIFGITLMLWICIQFVIFPFNFLSTIFFIFGLLQLIMGYATYVFYQQIHFEFSENNYPDIDKDSNCLVVYFSRMGYTKKIAYQKANELKADIIEIKTKERTANTVGFWWCGRFGMHHWPMPIDSLNKNIKEYSKIIIVSPIWVFSIAAPIREFCIRYQDDIKCVEYILTHHMKSDFINVANEMDQLLNIKRKKLTSICIRLGKVKSKHLFE